MWLTTSPRQKSIRNCAGRVKIETKLAEVMDLMDMFLTSLLFFCFRVLKPPGGGSSDIFGADNPTTPRSIKNRMQSNIFTAPAKQINGAKNGGCSRKRRMKLMIKKSDDDGQDSSAWTFKRIHRPDSINFDFPMMMCSISVQSGKPWMGDSVLMLFSVVFFSYLPQRKCKERIDTFTSVHLILNLFFLHTFPIDWVSYCHWHCSNPSTYKALSSFSLSRTTLNTQTRFIKPSLHLNDRPPRLHFMSSQHSTN